LKDYDRAIADYTAAITGDSARHARVYASRGNSWRAKGELDKALADFNQAIALDPQDSYALTSRAFIWMQKGDDAKAAADLDALANRDPSDPDLFGRGLAFFRGGRFAAAEKDFAAAVKKSPTQIKAIWLYLAQAHGGVPSASADLGKNAAPFEGKGWPQPVIHLYTGKLDETQLFAAAQDPDEKKKRDQECEANYYVAQKRLLAGNKDGARELLKKASADCPRDFIEYNSAVSDLARIK
jgi:lipoprotein NlpI